MECERCAGICRDQKGRGAGVCATLVVDRGGEMG